MRPRLIVVVQNGALATEGLQKTLRKLYRMITSMGRTKVLCLPWWGELLVMDWEPERTVREEAKASTRHG